MKGETIFPVYPQQSVISKYNTWQSCHCEGSIRRRRLNWLNWIHFCDPVQPQGATHFEPCGMDVRKCILYSVLCNDNLYSIVISYLNTSGALPRAILHSILLSLELTATLFNNTPDIFSPSENFSSRYASLFFLRSISTYSNGSPKEKNVLYR